jgi:very-short-patch-repair endonuclease
LTSKESKPDYEKRNLLTDAEFKFYNELKKIIPTDQTILIKIRLADLIKQKKFSDFRRISQKHVDFILAQKSTLNVIGIVELDDYTHQKQHRIERDKFVDEALKSAGIPISHITVKNHYDLQVLTNQLLKDIYTTANSPNPPPLPTERAKQRPLYPWQS